MTNLDLNNVFSSAWVVESRHGFVGEEGQHLLESTKEYHGVGSSVNIVSAVDFLYIS